MINTIKSSLKNKQFSLSKEKILQQELEIYFEILGFNFLREHRLNSKNIIDFHFPDEGIGMEIKIKGNNSKIIDQLERYTSFPEVKELIFVTAKTLDLPSEINGKPIHLIILGEAFL